MIAKYRRFFRISFKRLLKRKEISTHSIAMGFAVGIFVGFTPLVGFQIILSLAICYWFKYNKLSGFIAVFISNPFTFLPIYSFNYYIGKLLLGNYFTNASSVNEMEKALERSESHSTNIDSFRDFIQMGGNSILLLFLGSVVVGIVASVISYFMIKKLMDYYRKKHKKQ